MLIQEIVRPDSIIAGELLLVEFCNTIGQKRKSSKRAQRVRFAPESGQIADIWVSPLWARSGQRNHKLIIMVKT
jgi:hypothetical protein